MLQRLETIHLTVSSVIVSDSPYLPNSRTTLVCAKQTYNH